MVLIKRITEGWTLEQGIKLCRDIQPRLKIIGYHCGLLGGVLNKGQSENDLDVVVMTFGGDKVYDVDKLRLFLKNEFNAVLLTSDDYLNQLRKIYKGYIGDRMIDFFIYDDKKE